MRTRSRVGLVALVVVAAAIALVAIRPGSPTRTQSATPPATPAAARPDVNRGPAIRVVEGKPAGGVVPITAHKGEPVRFTVRSDVADEVHVHGFDLHRDVPAGGQVAFSFPATIDGIFVIELEHRGEQIAQLTVQP